MMTLWVNHDGPTVTIHGNVGLNLSLENGQVREFSVSEHAGHLRHFHTQLGSVLDEVDRQVVPAGAPDVPAETAREA
jgi:hypothetical protein